MDSFDARELARAWQSVLGRLQLELNPHNYATWLPGTRALSFSDGELVIEAKSSIASDWLHRRLRVVIERAANQAFPGVRSVRFVAAGEQLVPVQAEGPAANEAPASGPRASRQSLAIGTVNCEYTFEGYLATRGNELAVRAVRSIVEPSELVVSPVVLYGSPGMGKTHLLHALACSAKAAGRKVACLSAEEFANRFLNALRSQKADEFKEQIRTVDVLIIDDLQAVAGKKSTIDELVWTMDEVRNAGGHVVAASEQHPFELGFPERLESRLAAGIITRVEPFDLAERRQFVELLLGRRRTALPAWAVDRIAHSSASSVRLLLGAVNVAMALEAAGRLDVAGLDAAIGARVVAGAISESSERDLLQRVARCFGVAVEDLASKSRAGTEARAVAAALLQARGYTLTRLALLFERDKSTMSPIARKGREIVARRPDLQGLMAG